MYIYYIIIAFILQLSNTNTEDYTQLMDLMDLVGVIASEIVMHLRIRESLSAMINNGEYPKTMVLLSGHFHVIQNDVSRDWNSYNI